MNMKTNNFSKIILLAGSVFFAGSSFAQATLEFITPSSNTSTQGPSLAPIVVNFWNDDSNPNIGVFTPMANQLTATFSYRNQVSARSTVLTGTSTTVDGLTFGTSSAGSTGATGGLQVVSPRPLYNTMAASLPGGLAIPTNSMFQTSPSSTPAARTLGNTGQAGTPAAVGFDNTNFTNTYDDGPNGFIPDGNGAVNLFTSCEGLFDQGLPVVNGRYYFGELVITFNQAVKNPVVHIGGLGGNYAFRTIAGVPLITYFATELELQNTGVTSTFMAGNEFFHVDPTTNKILNGTTGAGGAYIVNNTPNSGSYDKPCSQTGGCTSLQTGQFSNYGAASGSVRVNGTVTQLVYKVYLRGGNNSTGNFSATQAQITTADHDPFVGDLYFISVSLDKPTQQLSGNVFTDADGLNDAGGGNIHQSAGVPNSTTNVGGLLYANLIDNDAASPTFGKVVLFTPVGANGAYLFDNVPVGKFTVQLTTNVGSIGSTPPATALPPTWVNTGEFIGTGVGSDGTVNGNSTQVVIANGDRKTNVDFGIEKVPETTSYTTGVGTPTLGYCGKLNDAQVTITGNTNPTNQWKAPLLSGSDPEDQSGNGSLQAKTIRITSLLTGFVIGVGNIPVGFLKYNNVPVTLGQTITNYNPALMEMCFDQPFPRNLPGNAQFEYAYVDAAGKQDPTPALYKVEWPGGIVPVTALTLDAIKNNCTANLIWTTATEFNVAKFDVEMSENNGNSYKTVGTVTATGTTTTTTRYNSSFAMQSGVSYTFRIKAIDKDGTYSYSNYRNLSCTEKGLLSIVPNPVADIFRINGMDNGKNTVKIYTAEGKLVKTQVIASTYGDVSIGTLATGMYIVNVINENGTTRSEQLIKK
jgi:Secretion system C-terminal sorting domain